jgi:hypothetical protein
VRLRGAQDDPAVGVGEGPADIDAAAVEVDVAGTQGGCLAPAQAGVSQQQNQQTPASGFGSEREDLAVGEVDVIAAFEPGQAKASAAATVPRKNWVASLARRRGRWGARVRCWPCAGCLGGDRDA